MRRGEVNILEKLLKQILDRLSHIENTMATKEEVTEIRHTMANEFADIRKTMADELADVRNTMATKKDVEEIPYIKKTIIETKQELNTVNQIAEETREEVKRIVKVQAEQQKVIEVLSVRTTEHEAKLKFA